MPCELDHVFTYVEGTDGLPSLMINEVGAYLHYPASPDDLFAVLRRMPRKVLARLEHIDLRHEPDTHRIDDALRATLVCDPYYGRWGGDWLPGVYCASCLGEYVYAERSIALLGFVYDPALPDRVMWEAFLRFVALSTLMHEVAHHVDLRETPDRDPVLVKARSEHVAEQYQERWTAEYVVPYLLETYPQETALFLQWVEAQAGVPAHLDELIPAPSHQDDALTGHAFVRELARLVASGASPAETRMLYLRFRAERTGTATMLPLVERYCMDYPDRSDALVLMATLWMEQEQWEGARSLLAALVKRDPTNQSAWLALIDCDTVLGDARRLQRTSARYAAMFPPSGAPPAPSTVSDMVDL
jgi:hypothetical protein